MSAHAHARTGGARYVSARLARREGPRGDGESAYAQSGMPARESYLQWAQAPTIARRARAAKVGQLRVHGCRGSCLGGREKMEMEGKSQKNCAETETIGKLPERGGEGVRRGSATRL